MYKQTIDQVKESLSNDPIDQVKKAIITFNKDLAKESLNKAIESKNDPLEIFAALY